MLQIKYMSAYFEIPPGIKPQYAFEDKSKLI